MSTKQKPRPAPAAPDAGPEVRNKAVSEAWDGVYGEQAAPPKIKYAVPMGGLPAGVATQLAEIAGRVGLPERIAFVCEMTVPREPGALPELTMAMPQKLVQPLRALAEAAGTWRKGTDAGLGLLLGCCGQIRYAVMQQAAPPPPPARPAKPPGPDLGDAITATLGLLRLTEKGAEDPSWCFHRNSPVWFLFMQNVAILEAAWEAHQMTGSDDRPARAGLALQVLETGSVPETGKAVEG